MSKIKLKLFNKKIFTKEMLKNKRLLVLLFILIGTIFITLGYSYAYFNKVVIGSNVDLRVGTINYSLDSDGLNSNYQATVSSGSEAVIEVIVNGLDDFASKYQMYYTGSSLDDVVVGYSSESTDLPYGEMSAKGEKNVTIVIQNNSSSDKTVTIGVAGGLNKYTVDDIVLKDGQYRITQEIEVSSFDIQLASVTIDGQSATSLPTSGTYTLSSYNCKKGSTLEWDTIEKSITFSTGTKKGESCSLEFTSSTPDDSQLLINVVKQGDYIAYEGNNGCLRNGTATASVTTSGQGTNENSNSCLGYNANANSDGSKDSDYGMYGYCNSSGYRYYVSGWRIAYTKDNRAYIISAGSPECTTRRNSTNGNTDYITDSYLDAKKYCNSSFVDDCTSDTDVHAINDTDYNLMTSEATNTTGGYLYTSISGATLCGGVYSKEVCGYNNDLIDNGGYYWFASAYSASSTDGVLWHPYYRYVYSFSNTYACGLRPVIRLSSSVYITGGSGTMDDPYVVNNMTFSINSNASYTTNSTVNLKLVGDGVSQMCISNTESCTNYESFAESKEWTLSSGDGEKTVYVYYKDSSGNIIANMSKSIVLDTTAPSNNSIQISSEDNITRTLTLSSTGADYMCFSNTSSNISDCTSWVDYKTSYTWSLTPNSGEKTVYAFFKDKAGNTASTSASVTCNNCVAFTVSEDFSDTTYDSNLTIAGSGSYPWVVDTDNLYFRSNNKNVNSSSSTSTIVFTPTNASKLSFDWGVSSESGWDKLTIKLTGSDSSSVTLVDAQSGTQTGSITDQTLSGNVTYTLTLTYTKDGSSYDGSDIGYIDNLYIGP